MQLYIPVTLLYQNLVTFQITGLKDYGAMSVSWWFAMILRVVGLFNLAKLFAHDTIAVIMDEYKDDWILLSMRRVRNTDKRKQEILIRFVRDLSHENVSRRIAAAIMLRRAAKPGVQVLTSSDPEKVESVNVFDALCARLADEEEEDEDGNIVHHPVEPDIMAKCAVCHALGVLSGPEDRNIQQVLRDILDAETSKDRSEKSEELRKHVEQALENTSNYDQEPYDDEVLNAWRAWEIMWVSISLLITVVVATFLEVVVLIKMMVLTGSMEEIAMIVMAVFFVNDLDNKVMKGQPLMTKMYRVQCYQHTKKKRNQPVWVKHITTDGAVPLVHVLLYLGLGLMVTISWKNRYTGEVIV